MADSTDFVPTEAEIEVATAYFREDVENLATDEEIVEKVIGAVDDYDARYNAQRSHYIEESNGIWTLCDWAFRACLNDNIAQTEKSKGANEPSEWERAKIGTTQFYRQVTQKAANGYAVQTSKDMPFKYVPLISDGIDSPEIAEKRADKMNLLAKWSMKRDKFARKSLEFWTQVNKYGNIPVMVEWSQKKQRKTIEVPVYDPENPGEVIEYKQVTEDKVVENRPVMSILSIESVKADKNIGNLQDQDCVEVCSLVGISDIVAGIEEGLYREDLIEDLTKTHQWDGYSGFENNDEKADNRGNDDTDSSGTGRYLKREVFINLPIDDGKWDEIKNVPKMYRVTMFGNQPTDSLVARVERNQEPDDSIPIEMIHCNPDDSDNLYHISSFEVIRSNIATETTLIRQVIDNNTLVNKPPLIELQGAVRGNNRTFGPDARWVADDINAIKEFNVRDVSQPSLAILDYLKEDSNTANSIDKNMIGESFGARTSATEAGTISGNSRRPNLVNIEYILDQFLGFVAYRYGILWEAYGRHDQIVQITDDKDLTQTVKPREAIGEYDIVIDIVNDIKDDEVKAQRMINGAQIYAQNPQLAQTMDWGAFSAELSQHIFGTDKFVTQGNDGDATDNALRNVALMLEQGQFPQMNDAMNLKKHLEIYKEARTQWLGKEELNPNVTAVLDPVIAQIEQRIRGGGGTGQTIAQNAPEAVRGGQLMSAALGGIQ